MSGAAGVEVQRGPALAEVAFESIYTAFSADLRRFVLWRMHDEAAADDVVQDAFLRLHVELSAGRAPSNVRAWLRRVAANLATSRGRRSQVAARHAPRLLAVAIPSTEDVVLRHDGDRQLLEALSHLRAEERQVLVLAAGGMRGPEIARRLGRSHAAVRALLCRARHHLRAEVAAEA